MRILLISDFYPISEEENFSQNPLKDFVQNWEKLGHEVRIIRPNCLIENCLKHKAYQKTGMYGNVENLNYILPFVVDIKKKIRTLFAPDIVLAHSLNGIIFANKLGCQFSIAVHSSDLEILKNPLSKLYYKPELEKAFQKARRIACPSHIIREKFLALYPQYKKKVFVSPCGINADNIDKRLWLEEEKEKIKVLTCADSIPKNQIIKIIKTCEKLERVELTVVGALKPKFEKYSNKAILLDKLSNIELMQKMSESDIFVFLKKNETFGNLYLMSMARGCLTVGLKNDGIDGILKDEFNGFLGENFSETLARVIEFPDKNWILNNGYETVLTLSSEKTSIHYINCLVGNSSKI